MNQSTNTHYKIINGRRGKEIHLKWKVSIKLIIYALIANGLIAFFIPIMIKANKLSIANILNNVPSNYQEVTEVSMSLLIPLVGLYLIYRALQTIFNSTVISINNSELKRSTAPLSWRINSLKFRIETITQLKVERYEVEIDDGDLIDRFRIMIFSTRKKEKVLLAGFSSLGEAVELKSQIEKLLSNEGCILSTGTIE